MDEGTDVMPVAIITGASKGLGRALGAALAERGWDLVLDARTAGALEESAVDLSAYGTRVEALPGDVTDAGHRAALVAAARKLGGVDLLVNNASALGAEPLVRLEELVLDGLRRALEVNVVAALGLVQEALPLLRAARAGAVVAVSSDAAAEAYETWGGYGASKAALDQLSAVLGEEEPGCGSGPWTPGTWERTCTGRPCRTTTVRVRRRTGWCRRSCGCSTNGRPVGATPLRPCWSSDDDGDGGVCGRERPDVGSRSGGAVRAGAG